jgi:formylglycine-generating enzyme
MRWLYATTLVFVSCAAAPRPGVEKPESSGPASGPSPDAGAAPTSEPHASTEGDAVPHASREPAPSGAGAATGPAASGQAAACPAGMVLVEGDYCTEVEHSCLESWFAEQNKKTVCEKFEPKATCVGQREKKRYCIDRYAWPGAEGERPEVMNNFYQAQVKCAAAGKRMCTESEWTFACEGPEMKPFPYGYERDPAKCNGDHRWDSPKMNKVAARDPAELARLWRGVPNGSQKECVSDFGVHDLPANVDEVVANEHLSGKKALYSAVNTGGPWYKGVRNQCRPKIYTHDEGFYYYYLGFRCCSNPDGDENDPRTPMQIQRGQTFSYVERLARFTVDEMKETLDRKAQGKCSCKETDIRCKTMCGTLLGPDAKDADGSHLKK